MIKQQTIKRTGAWRITQNHSTFCQKSEPPKFFKYFFSLYEAEISNSIVTIYLNPIKLQSLFFMGANI